MTRKTVGAHELHAAISVAQEMGLGGSMEPGGGHAPVSVVELSLSCRFVALQSIVIYQTTLACSHV